MTSFRAPSKADRLPVCCAVPHAFLLPMTRSPISLCASLTRPSPDAMDGLVRPMRSAAVAAALVGSLAACATREVPPANSTLPESLRTPPQEVLQDALTAVGESIYSCRRTDGQLGWVKKGTEATLIDEERRTVGTIVPGPRFMAYDGSFVMGHIAAEEIVATDALPWQLIIARRKGGEEHKGRFAQITSVQQVRTSGGLPPQTRCTQQGMSMLVPYSATYLLYRAANTMPLAAPTLTAPTLAAPKTEGTVAPAHAASSSSQPSSGAVLTVASVSNSSVDGLPFFFNVMRP